MIRIIDGKRYNTETATLIGEASHGYASDFHHWDESLYLSPKGAFFLSGSGGALSQWSEPAADGRCGGCGMRVLSVDEALSWAEEHDLDSDAIEKHFRIEEG